MKYSTTDFTDLNVIMRKSYFRPAAGVAECHVVLNIIEPGSSFECQLKAIESAIRRTTEECGKEGLKPVMMRYFLSDAANQANLLEHQTEPIATSIIEQPPLRGTKIAVYMYLVAGMTGKMVNGMTEYPHNGYRHVWYTGGSVPGADSESATFELLNNHASRLNEIGISFRDECARTWFFVHDVDVNYNGVVKGRNRMFDSIGLTSGTHFIASTGIGGRSSDPDVKVQMDAYSIGGLQPGQLGYLYARDHLNSTSEYGVAFERGAMVDYGDRRTILISGTASIDNKGRIVNPGNIEGQTERMIENVGALLAEAGADFDDVSHMTVYLRDMADYTCVSRIFEERFHHIPRVMVLAPVCRPGWLIEMECMATVAADNPQFRPF